MLFFSSLVTDSDFILVSCRHLYMNSVHTSAQLHNSHKWLFCESAENLIIHVSAIVRLICLPKIIKVNSLFSFSQVDDACQISYHFTFALFKSFIYLIRKHLAMINKDGKTVHTIDEWPSTMSFFYSHGLFMC